MDKKENYVSLDGNGNIVLQDINGNDININDIKAIKDVFENTQPEYIKELFEQLNTNYQTLADTNKSQIDTVLELLKKQMVSRNISTGNVSGTVHIGDVINTNNSKNQVYIVVIVAILIAFIAYIYFQSNKVQPEPEPQLIVNPPTINTDTIKKENIHKKGVNSKTEESTADRSKKMLKHTKLTIDVTTSKGKHPSFVKDEEVIIYYSASKACYVRLIYELADGQAVLMADNIQVTQENAGKQLEVPSSFSCDEPFGKEKLTIYAQRRKFEKLNIKLIDGYEIIQGKLSKAYGISEKGLKKNIEFVKKTINVETKRE